MNLFKMCDNIMGRSGKRIYIGKQAIIKFQLTPLSRWRNLLLKIQFNFLIFCCLNSNFTLCKAGEPERRVEEIKTRCKCSKCTKFDPIIHGPTIAYMAYMSNIDDTDDGGRT